MVALMSTNVLRFMVANIADALSTYSALNEGAGEANLLIGGVMEATSIPAVLIGKLMVAAAVGFLVQRWRPWLLTIPTVVFAILAISNSLIAFAYFF